MTSLLEATKGSSGSSAPTSLHSFGIGRRWREAIAGDKGRTTGILVAVFAVASIIFMIMDGFKLYFQRLIDGLSNGFIYAAVALALVLIYKATGVINFAQGNMAMFGTFIAWVLARERSWPVALAILVAMIVSAAFGAGFERVFIRPFDPANHLPIIIVTLALNSILGGLAVYIWFADPKGFSSPFPVNAKSDYLTVFGVRIFYATLGIWITVLAVTIGVTLLLNMTKIGLAFRAVSSNLESSRLVGVHVGNTLQFGWALAAAIGTLAGCLILSDTKNYLSPNFLLSALVFALAAAAIGGLDSLVGAVVGGLLVGQIQTMVGGYVRFVGSDLTLAFTLLLVIVFLLVRPQGLFGSKRAERV